MGVITVGCRDNNHIFIFVAYVQASTAVNGFSCKLKAHHIIFKNIIYKWKGNGVNDFKIPHIKAHIITREGVHIFVNTYILYIYKK